jgi:carbon starvation protein CstA
MKPQHWLPLLAFLATSIPVVLLLNVFDVGGEYRLWMAIGVGALAAALVNKKLSARGSEE